MRQTDLDRAVRIYITAANGGASTYTGRTYTYVADVLGGAVRRYDKYLYKSGIKELDAIYRIAGWQATPISYYVDDNGEWKTDAAMLYYENGVATRAISYDHNGSEISASLYKRCKDGTWVNALPCSAAEIENHADLDDYYKLA